MLEVFYGPMFAGKTEELILRFRDAVGRGVALKPALDDRYGPDRIVSHTGASIAAVPVAGADDVRRAAEGMAVVAVDEAQFLDEAAVDAVLELMPACHVIAAGLDLDFRGEPFPSTARLIEAADAAIPLTAVCAVCGAPATRTARTQRVPGDPRVAVGGPELYEPRCERHFAG
jgi:thymidine kinase